MNKKIKNRWLLVVITWSAVLIITLVNLYLKDTIVHSREKKIITRLDKQFLKQHSEKISAGLEQTEALYDKVDSLKLGLLAIEDDLTRLGKSHQLSALKLSSVLNQADGENIPVILSCTGYLTGLVAMLQMIQKNYPFLPVTKVIVDITKPKEVAVFQVSFNYRYKISSPGNES